MFAEPPKLFARIATAIEELMSVSLIEFRSDQLVMEPARFSVVQFDAILGAGVFAQDSDHRLQLLRGEIVIMTPPNPLHDDVVSLANVWAISLLGGLSPPTEVRCQSSMELASQDSVVLPAVAFVRSQSYSQRRPTPTNTRLVIEISGASLAYDLGEKMRLYAQAGVAEYWVIDVPHRALIVHLDPTNDRYRSVMTFAEHQRVEATNLPGIWLVLSTLFR